MATTTTNYGFDVPTSSDLVKNGATAISTLGQDIDTFLFRPFSKNAVINSSFDIWQRGTSILATASVNAYQADRWQGYSTSGNITVSRQATGDTTNLPNIQYCARAQRTASNASTGAFALTQSFESSNSIPFAGKAVTLSFYARAGANYSSASSVLNASLTTGTGTDQNLQGGYTGASTSINQNATLTTTWQRFTYTATLASTATELALSFSYTPTGTAGANDYFEITGVQLEAGSQATPFSRMAGTIQGELAACQRYYVRQEFGGGSGNYYATGTGVSTTRSFHYLALPASMRTAPSLAYGGTPAVSDTNTTTNVTNILFYAATTGNQQITIDARTASGLTQFRPYFLLLGASGQYIELSAEL